MRLRKSEIEHCLYVLENTPNIAAILWVSGIWLVVSYLQYLVISLAHVVLATILSVVLAVVVSVLSQALKQMGGNGTNSSGPPFSLPVFLISASLLLANILGVYQLVQRWTDNPWNGYVLYGWLIVLIGIPVIHGALQYISCYLKLKRHANRYVSLNLTIKHFNELPIHIHKIEFINTETGASEVYTDLKQNHRYYSQQEQQQEDLTTRIRHSMIELIAETIYIPINTNKFYLSWYSLVDDKYFSDEFPFKYEKFEPKEMKFPFHQAESRLWGIKTYQLNSITLHIKSKGRVDLYSKRWLRYFFWDVAAVDITEEQRTDFQNWVAHKMNGNKKDIQNEIKQIQTSGRAEKRFDTQGKLFLWSLSIDGLGEITHPVTIEDTEHKYFDLSIEKLREPNKFCLPEKITVYKRQEDVYFYYHIFLDREKLFDCVTTLIQGTEDAPIHLHFNVLNRMKKEMVLSIQYQNQSIVLNDWQIETTGT